MVKLASNTWAAKLCVRCLTIECLIKSARVAASPITEKHGNARLGRDDGRPAALPSIVAIGEALLVADLIRRLINRHHERLSAPYPTGNLQEVRDGCWSGGLLMLACLSPYTT